MKVHASFFFGGDLYVYICTNGMFFCMIHPTPIILFIYIVAKAKQMPYTAQKITRRVNW